MTKHKPETHNLENRRYFIQNVTHPFYILGFTILLIPVVLLVIQRFHLMSDTDLRNWGNIAIWIIIAATPLLLALWSRLRSQEKSRALLAWYEASQERLAIQQSMIVPQNYRIGDDGEIVNLEQKPKHPKKPHHR